MFCDSVHYIRAFLPVFAFLPPQRQIKKETARFPFLSNNRLSEILPVRLADDCELLAYLIKLDIVLSALGKERIYLIVICLHRGNKGRLRIAVPGFFVPFERFGAVCGKLFLALAKRAAVERVLRGFLLAEEFPIDMRHCTFERAARSLYLICIAGICVAGGDIEVDYGSVRRFQKELDVILGIAEGVCTAAIKGA